MTSTRPPIVPFESLFCTAAKPGSLLTTGDAVATPGTDRETGTILTKWVSEDGTKVFDAIGTPRLWQPTWLDHPLIYLDGASGFHRTDNALTGQTSGAMAVGFRRSPGSYGSFNTLVSASATNTTGANTWFASHQATAARNTSTLRIHRNGTSTKVYTGNDAIGRAGSYANAIWSSNASDYTLRAKGKLGLAGTDDGSWVPTYASFLSNALTCGFRRSTTDGYFFDGDISHFGWFSQYDDESLDLLYDWIEELYPSRKVMLLGDSRFNTDDVFTALETSDNTTHFIEVATGGYGIESVKTDWDVYAATENRFSDVVVLVGVNNSAGGATIGAMITAIEALVDSIIASGLVSRVLLCNETPWGSTASADLAEIIVHGSFSQALKFIADTRPSVTLVDTWSSVADPTNPSILLAANTTDGTHFTTAGYAALVVPIKQSLTDSVTASPTINSADVAAIRAAIDASTTGTNAATAATQSTAAATDAATAVSQTVNVLKTGDTLEFADADAGQTETHRVIINKVE